MSARRPRLTLQEYASGVRARDRAVLAQAITLVESSEDQDAALARELLADLMSSSGSADRVGITGVPGVGKSTLIDALGMKLLAEGRRVAVLAVDPSSSLHGGSILGDKTRMARLSLEPEAFIRPSPSGLSPGGIARRTRETILLCEAAGFDVILVETVGVGQGETAVSEMVDFFLVLALPGAGDELQGIKKGVLELADAIAVNKCDVDGGARARVSQADLRAALRYLPRRRAEWDVRVLAVSGLTGEGLGELWDVVQEHRRVMERTGERAAQRAEQQRAWLWRLVAERFERAFRDHPEVARLIPEMEADVRAGRLTAPTAADRLFAAFRPTTGQP